MNKYPILQSGFVSTTERGLIKAEFIKDPFVDFALDKDHRKSKNPYFYSKEVSDIYTDWLGDSKLLKDINFRERVLVAALKSFNSMSFYNWIQIQSLPETTGSLHQTFLTETLSFISGGPRTINIVQWINLLSADSKTLSVNFDFDKDFDRQKYHNVRFSSSLTTDIIQSWVSNVDGFQDLMIGLYVIFGSRPYVTDVANKNVG